VRELHERGDVALRRKRQHHDVRLRRSGHADRRGGIWMYEAG
jgi:hypothetical protein